MCYKARRDTITSHAWETWTNNGLGLDLEDRRETEKTVKNAVNNAYHDGIDDLVWLNETLRLLRQAA